MPIAHAPQVDSHGGLVAKHGGYWASGTRVSYEVPLWTAAGIDTIMNAVIESVNDLILRPMQVVVARPINDVALAFRGFQNHVYKLPVGLRNPNVGVSHVVGAKLARLEALEDGWLGPGSVRPSPEALRHYSDFLVALDGMVTLDAEAVPTADGAVRIEWERGDRERAIEFGADDSAWLFDSGAYDGPIVSFDHDDDGSEAVVEPFDVKTVVQFFVDGIR